MAGTHERLQRVSATAQRLAHRHRGEPFEASALIAAPPRRVLDVLSDTACIRLWFPIPCEFDDGETRLRSGGSYRVSGRLAGRTVHGQLSVFEGSAEHVAIRLAGPVVFDLDAVLSTVDRATVDVPGEPPLRAESVATAATRADVTMSVHPGGGFASRVLTPAASALLRSGALARTVDAIRVIAEDG